MISLLPGVHSRQHPSAGHGPTDLLSFEKNHIALLRRERRRLALPTLHQRLKYPACRSSGAPILQPHRLRRWTAGASEERGREDMSWQ
jgi:hypothetical protein